MDLTTTFLTYSWHTFHDTSFIILNSSELTSISFLLFTDNHPPIYHKHTVILAGQDLQDVSRSQEIEPTDLDSTQTSSLNAVLLPGEKQYTSALCVMRDHSKTNVGEYVVLLVEINSNTLLTLAPQQLIWLKQKYFLIIKMQ